MKYNDLDTVIRYNLKIIQRYIKRYSGPPPEGLTYSKMDMTSAFRTLPCSPESWLWTVLKAQHPVTGKTYYFADKNLAFGASISCSHFQRVSNALQHLMVFTTRGHWSCVNYLDDFLFIHTSVDGANRLVRTFMSLCQQVNFPLSAEKTEWGTTKIVFLQILLLGKTQTHIYPN